MLTFAWCAQDSPRAHEITMSAHNAQLAIGGLEWGVMPDQAKAERAACMLALKKVAGPMIRFMEVVAQACTADVAACVPQLSTGMHNLSSSASGSRAHIDRVCPPQFSVLFTALRDPFLVVNMATLAFLHATKLTRNVNMMLQAFSDDEFEQFGFFMGRVLASVLPLVRLPLTEDQMHQVMLGFVHSFLKVDGHARDGSGQSMSQSLEGGRPGDQRNEMRKSDSGKRGLESIKHAQQAVHPPQSDSATSSEASHDEHHRVPMRRARTNQCLKDTEAQLAPANKALSSIAGSLLNVTCYQEIAKVHLWGCTERAVNGMINFASMLQVAIHTTKDLAHSECPDGLVVALRRLDDKPQLALDFITNLVEDFGVIETHGFAAMDFFYDDKLFLFGSQLGVLYNEVSRPAFYKYRKVEFRYTRYSPTLRIMLLGLAPPLIFLFAALPLVCLFFSAVSGWPPEYDEVSVVPLNPDVEFALTYEFFGGRMPMGSQVEFVAATSQDPEFESQNSMALIRKVESYNHTPSMEDGEESTAVFKHERFSKRTNFMSIPVCAHTTHRLLLTLTDELDPMGCVQHMFWKFVGFMIPCLAGGGRRWMPQVFQRHGKEWRLLQLKPDARKSIAPLSEYSPLPFEETPPLEFEMFSNYENVSPPVADTVTEIAFNVRRATSAVLRISPAMESKECWDQLLFVSAAVQLLDSCWHLFNIIAWDMNAWLFEGEVLTFIWHWSRAATSTLAIHKKLHARWFAKLNHMDDKKHGKEIVCGYCRILRSPTPVRLIDGTPAVRSRVRPLLSWTYEERYTLEVEDVVKVVRWFHPKYGAVGKIMRASFDRKRRQYRVDFGDESQEMFSSHDLQLVDDEVRSGRTPVWRDRLTPLIIKVSLGMWLSTALSLMAFGSAMCDGDGYILLRIQAPRSREAWSSWLPGCVAFVQLVCISLELGARTIQWLLIACATAVCYATM